MAGLGAKPGSAPAISAADKAQSASVAAAVAAALARDKAAAAAAEAASHKSIFSKIADVALPIVGTAAGIALTAVGAGQYSGAVKGGIESVGKLIDGDSKGAADAAAKAASMAATTGLQDAGYGQYAGAATSLIHGDVQGAIGSAASQIIAGIPLSIGGGSQPTPAIPSLVGGVTTPATSTAVAQAAAAMKAAVETPKPYGATFPTRQAWEVFASNPLTAGGTVGHPRR